MKQLAILVGAAALALGGAGAAAAAGKGETPMEHSTAAGMQSESMGEHSMPATVTHVDHKTGLVHVVSEHMHMVLHFPPPAVADLKAGDKIKVHLSYTME